MLLLFLGMVVLTKSFDSDVWYVHELYVKAAKIEFCRLLAIKHLAK